MGFFLPNIVAHSSYTIWDLVSIWVLVQIEQKNLKYFGKKNSFGLGAPTIIEHIFDNQEDRISWHNRSWNIGLFWRFLKISYENGQTTNVLCVSWSGLHDSSIWFAQILLLLLLIRHQFVIVCIWSWFQKQQTIDTSPNTPVLRSCHALPISASVRNPTILKSDLFHIFWDLILDPKT